MNWSALKHWASCIAATFVGGIGGYASTHLAGAIPSTSQQWQAAAIGAGIAGLSAVAHLLQTYPAAPAGGAS